MQFASRGFILGLNDLWTYSLVIRSAQECCGFISFLFCNVESASCTWTLSISSPRLQLCCIVVDSVVCECAPMEMLLAGRGGLRRCISQ
jgi:hypothetical protein